MLSVVSRGKHYGMDERSSGVERGVRESMMGGWLSEVC